MSTRLKKLLLFALIFNFNWFLLADLIDVYKKGEIKLIPDKDFGKNTDWESLNFYDCAHHQIVVSPDGSMFVSYSQENSIYKFDENGNFLRKFGRKGQGPGEFQGPKDISILDDKYLLIGEYALNNRISLFDLNGRFIKLIRTKHSVFNPIALKDNKIALITHKHDETGTRILVIIRDLNTDGEINVASFFNERRKTAAGTFEGNVFISREKDGNLLIGFTNSQEISIFSPEGKKINSFIVKMERVKLTEKMKEEFYEMVTPILKEKKMPEDFIKNMRKTNIFPEYVPYYGSIRVDYYGNILVFYNTGYAKVESPKFQVYSPDGKYVCDSKISFGEYKSPSGILWVSHKNNFYCLGKLKNRDDLLQIIKMNLR